MGSEVFADEEIIMCGNFKLNSKVVDEEEAGPATPDENGEHNHNHKHHDFSSSSPSPPPPPPCCNYDGLQTPKDTLFDSFAPASDKFLLAPHHRKYREESRNLVVRRLDFTKDNLTSAWSSDEENEEDRLFEIVYGSIMDAILAEQQLGEEAGGGGGSCGGGGGGGGTPKSAPFLNGIAETCPAAPIKSGRKHRFIDKEICKKLDFF